MSVPDYNPLVQPDASAINIYFQPPPDESVQTGILVCTWTSEIILVRTSIREENHYVEHPIATVRVFTSANDDSNEIESLATTIKVTTSATDSHNVESLTASTIKIGLRLNMWKRSKTGFIMIGDPPRRA